MYGNYKLFLSFIVLLSTSSLVAAFYPDYSYGVPMGRKYPSLKSVKGFFASMTKNVQSAMISLFPSMKTDVALRNTVTRSAYAVSVALFLSGLMLGSKSWNEVARQLREFEEQGMSGKNMRQLPRLFCLMYGSFFLTFFSFALVAGANKAYSEASGTLSLL
jgi:hypothetical protein